MKEIEASAFTAVAGGFWEVVYVSDMGGGDFEARGGGRGRILRDIWIGIGGNAAYEGGKELIRNVYGRPAGASNFEMTPGLEAVNGGNLGS